MIPSRYSTKSICQIFNITRETLRHYERMGLLNPYINPENGYREYSYWDVCAVIDILKYRSFGLSIADIKEAIFNTDFPLLIDSLEAHTKDYEEHIRQYELLLKKAKRDLGLLRDAKDHMGELIETEIEDLFYIPYTTDPSSKYFPSMQKAFDNSQFFTTGLILDDDHHDMDCYGLVTENVYINSLKIDEGTLIKSSPVISQMIDLVGRTPIAESFVDDFRTKISRKYGKDFDTVYAVLVSRFYDNEKRYHQYFFVFSKLE